MASGGIPEVLDKMAAEVIPTKQGVITVGGEEASIVCSNFGNKILLCISHYQKFGTLIHVSKDASLQKAAVETYTINTLLGKDDELHNVFARGIAEKVYSTLPQSSPPSLLIALSLKELTPTALKELVAALPTFSVWT